MTSRYVQFHHASGPACGSDSIAYFDGRWRMGRVVNAARELCRKRGFAGFTVESGPLNCSTDHTIRALELIE